jgi:polysaccharide export outer membrane protein
MVLNVLIAIILRVSSVVSTLLRQKPAATALIMALGVITISNAAQTDQLPPSELVQYIRETVRRGLPDAKIKSQAIAVGWAGATVDEALAYVRNEKSKKKAPSVAAAAPVQSLPAPTQPPSAEADLLTLKPAPSVPASSTNRGAPDDYVIGGGDTLQISVWNERDASVPVAIVRPDGKITVPLIKEVEVAGLTPVQVEQRITEKLTKFIADANVTVVVATISSKKVYVIGAARKEGPLPYTYGMTVMQALSEAGGLNDYAKRKKIYILRTENGREYRLEFNYDDVLKGESMEQNHVLLAGDTVVIPH